MTPSTRPTRIPLAATAARPGPRVASGPITAQAATTDPDPLFPSNLGNSEVESTFSRGPARRPLPVGERRIREMAGQSAV